LPTQFPSEEKRARPQGERSSASGRAKLGLRESEARPSASLRSESKTQTKKNNSKHKKKK